MTYYIRVKYNFKFQPEFYVYFYYDDIIYLIIRLKQLNYLMRLDKKSLYIYFQCYYH